MFAPFRPQAHPRFLSSATTLLAVFTVSLYNDTWSDGHSGEAAFPGANGEIAFESHAKGNGEVYVMETHGSNQANLTSNSATGDYPPDAQQTPGPTATPSARPGVTFDYDGESDGQWLDFDPTGILLLLSIWSISILAAAYIAHQSGRLLPKWVLWSMLTGPLAVLVLSLSVRLHPAPGRRRIVRAQGAAEQPMSSHGRHSRRHK